MATLKNLEEADWGFYIDIEKNFTQDCENFNKVYHQQISISSVIEEERELYEKESINKNTCFYCIKKFCCLSNITLVGFLTYVIFWTI